MAVALSAAGVAGVLEATSHTAARLASVVVLAVPAGVGVSQASEFSEQVGGACGRAPLFERHANGNAFFAVCTEAAGRSSVPPIGSPRWAGYVLTGLADTPSVFTMVTATWKQPESSCARSATTSAAAIWVGIGGYAGNTQQLEQIGSTTGCDGHGKAVNTSWFAMLPYPPHKIPQEVRPGDTLTAAVAVLPEGTRLSLVNRTRRWAFVRTISVGPADTSSAEWIVEAPMNCVQHTCRQMPLAHCGSVTFSEASVVIDGRVHTLNDPISTVTPIALDGGADAPAFMPGSIDDQGTSFTVSWHL